jgi:tetratricopeptide (TPR) repeat protein
LPSDYERHHGMQADREHDLQGRAVHRLYSIAQLARILDVPASTVRGWMRVGLIKPVREVKRLCFFDFQQLANARALSRLAHKGVTPARIRASLDRLGGWLPDAQASLRQLEALEQKGPLLVRLDDGNLAETSGQLLLDFDGTAAATNQPRSPLAGSRLTAAPTPGQPARTVVDWFARGLRAEEEADLEAAAGCYEQALRQDYTRAETWFNLGNVLYSLERKAEAIRAFTRASGLDPEYVEAWNNLGNTLSDEGQADDAVQAYEQALALEPAYMDAHYNLAETLANKGEWERARKHWREYLRLDPNSRWAQKVRHRLGE